MHACQLPSSTSWQQFEEGLNACDGKCPHTFGKLMHVKTFVELCA